MGFPYEERIKVGDRVVFSTHQNFADPQAGIVITVGGHGCHISRLADRSVYRSCWHVEDPRVQDDSAFATKMRLEGGSSGVFRLSESEELIASFPRQMREMKLLLQRFGNRIAALEKNSGQPEPDSEKANAASIRNTVVAAMQGGRMKSANDLALATGLRTAQVRGVINALRDNIIREDIDGTMHYRFVDKPQAVSP